ncbi:MAG: translation initiation factor IF-6 [Candidatus Woesearchaeota archaeon]|jgi:translation initiation factor 6
MIKEKYMDTLTINKNPNIGLYALATDNYCLVGYSTKDEEIEKIKEVLKVPVHKISIAGTDIIGIFCAANNNMLLVPEIIYDEEKKHLQELNIPFTVIKTRHTALGNNIVTNDQAAFVSDEFSADAKKLIRQALGTILRPGTIGGVMVVGSSAVVGEKGLLVHRDADQKEIEYLKETFNLPVDIGTVNMGSPYVRAGILINKNGYLIGSNSGGPEIQRADYALGFIE